MKPLEDVGLRHKRKAPPLVYIAGPFRAVNQWEQERNVRMAEELALDVWQMGGVAICPHTNTRYFQGVLPDHVWLTGDLEIVRRCDALLLCPGWERSVGAQSERTLALKLDIPIFGFRREELDKLQEFIHGYESLWERVESGLPEDVK